MNQSSVVVAMKVPKITSTVVLVIFIVALIWLLLTILSPYLVEPGTLTDLTGTVGSVDNDEQFESLNPVPKFMYSVGDRECHQIANRSFFLNGNQMPFCARDLGLFAGLAAGFGIAAFILITLNPVLLLLGLVPMGVDGGVQAITDYESNNPLRLATGILAGLAVALILAEFIYAFKKDSDERKLKRAARAEPLEAGSDQSPIDQRKPT